MRPDRAALSALDAQRLRELLDESGLSVADRRSREQIVEALCSKDGPTWEELLASCTRDELKSMCRATGRPDDGREKALLIARLLGDRRAPERDDGADVENAWRLRVLQLLSRDELKGLVDRYEIANVDRRNGVQMAQLLAASSADLAEALEDLPRVRLKELCRIVGFDDGGREKAPLVARLANKGGDLGPPDQKVYAPELTLELLKQVLGPAFIVERSESLWPARVRHGSGDEALLFDIYVRRVGPSRSAQERRIQNPTTNQAIVVHDDAQPLVLGLWLEQGLERAVFVAFDPWRRVDRTTRFSMFTSLGLLESAADSGFATHQSESDEKLYAFRPQYFTRYLDTLRDEASPRPVRAPTTPPRTQSTRPLAPVDHDRVEIRPKAGMFAAFARLNYKHWFALAELVDNAVQSYLANHARLEAVNPSMKALLVDITLEEGELTVLDRAAGIPFAEFGRAFSPATPPTDTTGLSEFGLGMKAAASWYAREWSVRTTALGDPHERTVSFDVARIASEGLDHLPIERREARADDHYTEIRLKPLRQQPRANTVAKMKEHLASIYRLLIKDGTLELRFTTPNRHVELLKHPDPALLSAPPWNAPNATPVLWRKSVNIELHGKRITGWAGLLETGKYAQAGFAVFRRQRLIEGSVGEAYRPSIIFGAPNTFTSQRLIGELYVEGFEVTHTKDGIQWGADEEDLVHELRRQLDSDELPLIRQAMNYRAKNLASKLIPSFGGEALEAVSDALSSVAMATAMARTPRVPEDTYEQLDEPTSGAHEVMQSRPFRMQIQAGKVWNVTVQTVRDPAAQWLEVRPTADENGTGTVTIAVNLDHPFSEEHMNGDEKVLEPMMHLAACIGLAEQQSRLQGVKNSGSVRTNLNQMLRGEHAHLPVTSKRNE